MSQQKIVEDYRLHQQGPMASRLAGVDEAGRGPLAGPVLAAAVILDPDNPIEGLADSKKLTEKKRDLLYQQIIEQSLAYAIGRAEVSEIEQINILQASLLAMKRAILALSVTPKVVWVDGIYTPQIDIACYALVKGDSKMQAISAASILAKVERDREMIANDAEFPQYGFAKHKGYPTATHIEALQQHGPCSLHRRTYAPVQKVIAARDYNEEI